MMGGMSRLMRSDGGVMCSRSVAFVLRWVEQAVACGVDVRFSESRSKRADRIA